MSAWLNLLGAVSFFPDSEHIWQLIEALAFPVAAWELLKHLYRWIFRRRSRLEQRLELIETETREKTEEIHKLRSEKQQLSAELERARSRLPQAAIARADREWRDRNTVAAFRQLETWFEENAESITAIALHLAKFHISRAIPDPGNHLDRARDLLRLARGASPHNREVQELSSELDTVNAGLQEQLIRDGDIQIAWNSAMAPRLGAQGEAMLPAVTAFQEIAQYCLDKGLWRLAPIFADRAADLALSGGGALRQVWFSVETRAASYQLIVGNAADGLQRVDHVLAQARESLPARDEIVLSARHVRASALFRLGRYGEALQEMNSFAQIQAAVRGERHSSTLETRFLRAHLLVALGPYGDALAELEHLIPVVAEVKGARHTDTLKTRSLRAMMLTRLGRYRDALLEFENLMPVEVEVRGARHPETLTTRYSRASVVNELGRYCDVLREIEDFAQINSEVKGARHPDSLAIRYLRAYVLSNLGRYDEALAELDDLTPVEIEVRGARHPETLSTRSLRALCLANLTRRDEALSEIGCVYLLLEETLGASQRDTILARSARIGIEIAAKRDVDPTSELREVVSILTVTTGPSSLWTLFARYRLSRFLFQSGHADQARAEIIDTIAHFDPITDPSHTLLRSAKALLDAIEGHSIGETLIV